MTASTSPLAESVAPAPRHPHGYASDADALRVVAATYRGGSVDAALDYYRACATAPSAQLRGYVSRERDRMWDLEAAARRLEQAWAQSLSRAGTPDERPVREFVALWYPETEALSAWEQLVHADVLCRLAGDMGRPLPEPPPRAPKPMVDADQPPTALAGGVEAGEVAE